MQDFELFEQNRGIAIGGWHFRVEKGPIGSSDELERIGQSLGIKLPSMVFTRNHVEVDARFSGEPDASGEVNPEAKTFKLKFDPIDALREVGQSDPALRVRAAKDWELRRSHKDVKTLENPSDWTFTTKYAGEVICGVKEVKENTEKDINYEQLKRRDIPILYYNDVLLFEDELDDNGVSSFTVRMRISRDFFLILTRFWLRVDDVVVRLLDTRYYHAFGDPYIIRDWRRKESYISELSNVSLDDLKYPDTADQVLSTTESRRDELVLE
eukprot:Plantae.Rhodophyta-Purpureofilum_apyrenoidigerum.ctg16670.p1 GENE.Plantae.Rhodophyta-Purpureofilum_apyrenoidigerum.ctg16670~~Plantae.Rhodophyta-Purpureofilum_apyrenoidigerum.ctg16670.p1  ORF type:complete len:269 (-),score=54.75 Plantae.Rhodophyta-Purpureofilum_apyrenoidigerum.ctg16670:334-1140(-)